LGGKPKSSRTGAGIRAKLILGSGHGQTENNRKLAKNFPKKD